MALAANDVLVGQVIHVSNYIVGLQEMSISLSSFGSSCTICHVSRVPDVYSYTSLDIPKVINVDRK